MAAISEIPVAVAYFQLVVCDCVSWLRIFFYFSIC